MSAVKMPEWPVKPENYPMEMDTKLALTSMSLLVNYECALAAAWEARARVAVEALSDVADKQGSMFYTRTYLVERARIAIDAIGPLPPTERAP